MSDGFNTPSDDDNRDLTSNVGATATMAAAARAAASRLHPALVSDPFAELLVREVGVDFFIRLAACEDIDFGPGLARLIDVVAARTRHFDEYLTEASESGAQQLVILASGLDSRPHRLRLAPSTSIYEIDRAGVISYKTTALARLGIGSLTNHHVAVSVDLRADWPTSLLCAGFDRTQPTAWLAEGLFGYLPPDAQDRLIDDITSLSTAGSRFAADVVPNLSPPEQDNFRRAIRDLLTDWRAQGLETDMSTDMVYLEERSDLADYAATRGWTTESLTASDLLAANGLRPTDDDDYRAPFAMAHYVSATRTQ